MEADFAVDRTIIVEFGPSISGDGVHLVGALPSEVGGIGKEGAIEAADHASELELTEPVSLELDVGGFNHIQVITAQSPISMIRHLPINALLAPRLMWPPEAWVFARDCRPGLRR